MSDTDSDEHAEDAGLDAVESAGSAGAASSVAPGAAAVEASDLDTRYGRIKSPRRGRRAWLIGTAVAAIATALGWIVWASLASTDAHLDATDVSHTLRNDERLVDVSWQLSVRPGTATTCIVKALNPDFTVVGWKVVDVPASDREIRVLSTTLRTALPANTGLVDRCWIP
ncbi:MAG TPA: DUF4307 domain-containing protein [Candidatus Lumbricidophila sp.]|nr:DUF4307 domain-containing protein [Candidatus Lumbricidophila sp.]